MKRFLGPLYLLLCTTIWGAAFLAQKLGASHFGPFAITCYRNTLGGLFLLGLVAVWRKGNIRCSRRELVGGAASGVFLFLAMMAQQIGIEDTTPGVSAFLTANYVLIVPILAWLLGKGRPSLAVDVGVLLALLGTALICLPGGAQGLADMKIGKGESWTLACAVLFALQIMAVDWFAHDVDVVKFSTVQLFASAIFAFPFVFLPSELARASCADFVAGLPALLFIGILSSGMAYTLQNLGQARTPPALAAIIMSMESVFGTLFGWLFRHDVMSPRQLCGCACVFLAIVISQLLPGKKEVAA